MIVSVSASTTQGYGDLFIQIYSIFVLFYLFRVNLTDEELQRAIEGCDIVRIHFHLFRMIYFSL